MRGFNDLVPKQFKIIETMAKNIFSNNIFLRSHLENIIKKAGSRYTPKLNVNLPISEIFDGISRTEMFYSKIREKYGELLREFRYVTANYEDSNLQEIYDQTKKEFKKISELIESIKDYNTGHIPWDEIKTQTKALEKNLWEFIEKLRSAKEQIKDIKVPPRQDGAYRPSPSEQFSSNIHHLYKTQEIISYFGKLSVSTEAQLSNHPFLLLTGSAGTGKTHLLCDVVEQRLQTETKALPAFLVFGEYFTNEDNFWNQALRQLKIESSIKTKEDLLKKLDNIGKKAKCRSLLIIDALNENITHAPDFWKINFNSIIKSIKKHPNIALIVSVRSGFEKEVLKEKQKDVFIHEEHSGFRFREWEAVNKFFKAFKLPLPEIPLLMPEFQNPLFLLLFCKAFEKRKQKPCKQIFRGHEGATYIFEAYIDSISKPIEKKFQIDHGPKKNIWDTVIEKIAEEMVSQNDERIAETKLVDIIQKAHPTIDSGRLIHSLESNMLIVKVPSYENGKRTDGFDIRFPFQKFSDHLIGRYIFKKYENEFGKENKNLRTAKVYFSKKRKLGKLLSESWNRGLIEALSIQCPEQLKGIEFIEVVPYMQKEYNLSHIARESFIESLVWRNPKAFSTDCKNTLKIINRDIIRMESGHDQLLNAFLSVAPIPNHPFNAERLHQHLLKFSMPKRDSWWLIFLNDQYGARGAVDRLIEWSWSNQNYSHINDESIFLTSTALSWFLSISNRYIRDRATKGLVCLLQNRIHLLPKLLAKFKNVNDPYVIERLFAVAYGCVLRNQEDIENLKTLAEWVYENIFKENKPPLHILLRDYARGVIETALRRGIKIKLEKGHIYPPYKSTWPQNIPSEEELKNKYYPDDVVAGENKDRGYLDIWFSVMSHGDFARYVIGTNHWSCEWSGRKLDKPEPNRKNLFEEFKKQLTNNQRELLGKATNPFYGVDLSEMLKRIDIVSPDIKKESAEERELIEEKTKQIEIEKKRKHQITLAKFEDSLSKHKRIYFNKEIKPFLNDRGSISDPLETFDLKLAQRWIFNRVVELGYDSKLHGEFDSRVNRYANTGRTEHKAERIGKKYQWIAYHEFMALVSDHFEFKRDRWNESNEKYKGPWNPYIRDIDPSFVLQDDTNIKESATFSNWQESHGCYDAWEKTKSDIDWIKTISDLPNPQNIIRIIDDKKKEWLMLEGYAQWQEKTPPEHKKYDIPVREVWYLVKSYIVKKKDAKNAYAWAREQDFMGRWMPESHNFYETFLGEYPNSSAFENLRGDCNLWIKAGRGTEALPVTVTVTDDSYLNEFTLDCSHTGSVSVKLPCKWLVNNMGLSHNFVDGRFYDETGKIAALATSIFEENFPSALLIDRKALINFLDKNGYAIFWTLIGEKQMIGGSHLGKNFIGRLKISGAYTFNDKKLIAGKRKSKFQK